ncbi:MAG: RES family NAD+ phosphorylase [Tunicatimonas sp.]|uniref:RES family NAD+ phosphorylase n=1 Tax=Tunicatimonas sp. TaxID=1940096 RepID=UPI003C769403
MEVYRICLKKWSTKLTTSGFPARWNSKGKFVLYTASSRALACLENVVHRSGEGLNGSFKVMVIKIPNEVAITEVEEGQLPMNWIDFAAYSECQKIGDQWVNDNKTLLLKVPSAIIQKEHNYLLNINHPQMSEVKILGTEDFQFDSRIKGN